MKISLPIFAFFLAALHLECKCQKINEFFLLPKQYRGKVVVVYNRPFGEMPKNLNDTIYYTIPNDGISLNTTQIISRLEHCEFYQVDTAGKRKKLRILTNDLITNSPDSINLKNEIGIFIFGTIGSCNSNERESFCYSDFYVGTLNEMPNYYTPKKAREFSSRLDAKAKWKK